MVLSMERVDIVVVVARGAAVVTAPSPGSNTDNVCLLVLLLVVVVGCKESLNTATSGMVLFWGSLRRKPWMTKITTVCFNDANDCRVTGEYRDNTTVGGELRSNRKVPQSHLGASERQSRRRKGVLNFLPVATLNSSQFSWCFLLFRYRRFLEH